MNLDLIDKGLEDIEGGVVTEAPEDKNKVGNFTDLKLLELNPESGSPKTLKFLVNPNNGNVTNVAKLCGDLLPMTCNYTSDNRFYVTPYGGPTITEREEVPNNPNFMVKKIHYISEKESYVIELQRKDIE